MSKEENQIFIGYNLTVMNNSIMDCFVGKIMLIYIDPPYNTGSQMSYSDKSNSNQWLQDVWKGNRNANIESYYFGRLQKTRNILVEKL